MNEIRNSLWFCCDANECDEYWFVKLGFDSTLDNFLSMKENSSKW